MCVCVEIHTNSSPSHRASFVTSLYRYVGRAGEAQRQSHVTQVGAKLGQNWGIVGVRTTRCPNQSSGVCSAIPLD